MGCGTGVFAREVTKRVGPNGSVTGLDLSDSMLQVARSICPDANFQQGNAMDLPFEDGSFDVAVASFMLMFVPDPALAVSELWRVLKPGGWVFSVIPFMQPFHASPHDYQRYTGPGIDYLHRDFKRLDSGPYNGPTSAFVWVTQEYLALVFSLGWRPLRDMLSIAFMLVLWPLKFLDFFFQRFESADNMASTFFFHGQK